MPEPRNVALCFFYSYYLTFKKYVYIPMNSHKMPTEQNTEKINNGKNSMVGYFKGINVDMMKIGKCRSR